MRFFSKNNTTTEHIICIYFILCLFTSHLKFILISMESVLFRSYTLLKSFVYSPSICSVYVLLSQKIMPDRDYGKLSPRTPLLELCDVLATSTPHGCLRACLWFWFKFNRSKLQLVLQLPAKCARRISNLSGPLWSCWVFLGDDTDYVAAERALSKR